MRKILLIVIGLALLGYGGYRQFAVPGVNAADQARCEQIVRDRNANSAEALASMLPMCSDPGMVAMMDAEASGDGAQAAAQRIAAANQADTGSHMLDWFLIGLGLVLVIGGAVTGRRRA